MCVCVCVHYVYFIFCVVYAYVMLCCIQCCYMIVESYKYNVLCERNEKFLNEGDHLVWWIYLQSDHPPWNGTKARTTTTTTTTIFPIIHCAPYL